MITLTDEQEKLLDEAEKFYKSDSQMLFQYSGPAGTGKSLMMTLIIQRLGLKMEEVAPMAYTGAAAIVLRRKGMVNAKTIHSWLFDPVEVTDYERKDAYTGKPLAKIIFKPKPLPENKKLICIDEAGMVPMKLRKEIETRKIKVIACGDVNQLPPVIGDPAYLYKDKVFYLTKTMRQEENSGIVYLANRILKGERLEEGTYGNVCVIHKSDLTLDILKEASQVLCGKNNTRLELNTRIKEANGFSLRKELPQYNEKVICRKNNWRIDKDGINLANGLIGLVKNSPDISTYKNTSFKMDFYVPELHITFDDLRCNKRYFCAKDVKEKEIIKNSRFEHGEFFETAYAITTHLSQGSQFTDGVYISEWLKGDIKRNLDYTGLTRFSDSCIYVLDN